MIPHHHVVLDHAEPPGFRIAARSGRLLDTLALRTLLHVRPRAIQSRLLVVPERKSNGARGLDIG